MGVASILVVDDAMEVDEWVMPRSILVRRRCGVGTFLTADWYLSARRVLAAVVVPHILHVATPGQLGCLQLVRKSPYDGRVNATLTGRLTIGIQSRLTQ